MFGWKLFRDSEVLLQERLVEARIHGLEVELARVKEYAAKCERLVEHERSRIDSERERADRTTDALLQQNGLPSTTSTVRREEEARAEVSAQKQADWLTQLSEIYGETMQDLSENEIAVTESQGNA